MSAPNATGQASSQQVDPAVDKLVRETKALKAKIDLLEAENRALKKSLYDLSYIYSAHLGTHTKHSRHGLSHKDDGTTGDDGINAMGSSSNDGADRQNSVHSDMTWAMGQLLTSLSAAQQSQGGDPASSNTANNSDTTSRGVDSQLKNADMIKVEDEGVRRLNMGSIVSRQDGSSKSDGRQFYLKNDLKGHQGAVYSVQYSPNGKFLATGSFDKTVRIWDGTTNQNEVGDLASDIGVMNVNNTLERSTLTCFDQYNNIFFNGTTRNFLNMMDTRKDGSGSGPPITIKNDAMINSIYVYHDGLTVISGDSSGYLKTWDIRMGKVLQSILNEPTKKPISHISVSKQRCAADSVDLADAEEQESRWLAVNSYDNVIRVYDRGFEPPTTIPRLIHSLKGYRNKHWPIKSAFFHGKDCKTVRRSGKVRGADGDEPQSILSDKDIPLESSLILASGSMDPYIYLFDVGAGDGQYELLQKLSGHTDRVYDVDFHPIDHVLVSGSADVSVKVWGRASKRKK
ncbi:hypothetical protein BGX31_002575 [Mortierella sp. GBA43]|nr:hypothetical protein BGX31_002575 [Mortierella sp. GBA43]